MSEKYSILLILTLFLCSCAKRKCDLKLSIQSISPANPKINDRVVFTFRVENLGPDILPRSSYSSIVKINGKTVEINSGNSIRDVHEYSEFSKAPGFYHFIVVDDEPHTYSIEVIPKKKIIDSDTSNNLISGELRIKN